MKKPLLVLAILVAATFALSACASSDEGAEAVAEDSTAPAESTFNDADVTFAQGMIPRHSQAVEMATMALEQSSDPTILDLASRIQGAQDPEIEQMRGWLTLWGQEGMAADMEGLDMGSAEGMMDDTDPEVRALAEAIITAQEGEITEMLALELG